MMNRWALLLCLISLWGCQNPGNKDKETIQSLANQFKGEGIDFVGFDSNLKWFAGIDLDKNTLIYYTKKDTTISAITNLVVKNGAVSGLHAKANFNIIPISCNDTLGYRMSFTSNENQNVGCGTYLTPRYELLGNWQLQNDSITVRINFIDGRKFIGHDGCNQFFGSYSLQDIHINFGAVSGTKKFCPNTFPIISKLDSINKVSFKSGKLIMTDNEMLKYIFIRKIDE